MYKFLVVSLFLVLFSVQANAQTPPPPDKMDILTLRSALGSGPFMFTSSLDMPGHMEYGLNFMFGLGLNPFSIKNMDGDALTDDRAKIVSLIGMGELGGWLGIKDKYMVGLSIPVGFVMGNEIDVSGNETDSLSPVAWGDLTIHGRGNLFKIGELNLGVDLRFGVPTGKYSNNFTGENWPTLASRVVGVYKTGKMTIAGEAGVLLRLNSDDTKYFDDKFNMGSQFVYGAGFSYKVSKELVVNAELTGRSGFTNNVHEHPIEFGINAGYKIAKGLSVQAGGNIGILEGIGTPLARFLVGIRWVPRIKDSDGDGVPDEDDKCPKLNEDMDGYKDNDGCPDTDNDADGLPDKKDKCPDKAEDIDGFEDEDGCPEADNDKDGIPDEKDNCPNKAGPKKNNGCPATMIDTDGDTVSDAYDKCPNIPGTKAREGCPAEKYDSDKDGVMDNQDKCPKVKGSVKYTGCPASMFDTDKDGIYDDTDKCPNKPETINGKKDLDGCPDRGKSWISAGSMKIAGTDIAVFKIKFPSRKAEFFKGRRGKKAKLSKYGKKALMQVMVMLQKFSSVKKLQIMIFTDKLVSESKAVTITQAQAETMKKWIVANKFSLKRIEFMPSGNALPVYKGRNKKKQKRNRRIIFKLN
jgi:OmpA family/Putative MetA-pathway of phenol degradation/Thrombospondin type 3 repeat